MYSDFVLTFLLNIHKLLLKLVAISRGYTVWSLQPKHTKEKTQVLAKKKSEDVIKRKLNFFFFHPSFVASSSQVSILQLKFSEI